MNFLGHTISQDGIEVDEKKAEKIENWPVPTSAVETHAFLGLVRYLSAFLPKLAVQSNIWPSSPPLSRSLKRKV